MLRENSFLPPHVVDHDFSVVEGVRLPLPGGSDRVINYLDGELTHSGFKPLIIEGPPVYLWGNREYPGQAWNARSFVAGWSLTDAVLQTFSPSLQDGIQHWLLIDDIHNVPAGFADLSQSGRKENIWRFYLDQLDLLPSPISILGHSKQAHLESDLLALIGEDSCTKLDALFQLAKIMPYFDSEINKGLQTPLVVVTHPMSFQKQQAAMLSNLLGVMKQNEIGATKSARRDLVQTLYRHIWFDGTGTLDSITLPVWDGQKFIFEPIPI